ncbi:hypothetical protein F5148DRAFT_188858 [Russula earlei]|uniref:Uncharacterized protein n=1 Tax=Russula earlei TaxID=71964 RepID=A0ACC0U4Z9_9AGAM|nr:hypothetical protein F5148DRAFT_188858 [Russula earlei]
MRSAWYAKKGNLARTLVPLQQFDGCRTVVHSGVGNSTEAKPSRYECRDVMTMKPCGRHAYKVEALFHLYQQLWMDEAKQDGFRINHISAQTRQLPPRVNPLVRPRMSGVSRAIMNISSFFPSLIGTIYADVPEEKVPDTEPQEQVAAEAEAEAEAEEEEPEDIHPKLREEAQESPKCKSATQHFHHCQEKVQSGKGFKHEDCVEEMCTSFSCN